MSISQPSPPPGRRLPSVTQMGIRATVAACASLSCLVALGIPPQASAGILAPRAIVDVPGSGLGLDVAIDANDDVHVVYVRKGRIFYRSWSRTPKPASDTDPTRWGKEIPVAANTHVDVGGERGPKLALTSSGVAVIWQHAGKLGFAASPG